MQPANYQARISGSQSPARNPAHILDDCGEHRQSGQCDGTPARRRRRPVGRKPRATESKSQAPMPSTHSTASPPKSTPCSPSKSNTIETSSKQTKSKERKKANEQETQRQKRAQSRDKSAKQGIPRTPRRTAKIEKSR